MARTREIYLFNHKGVLLFNPYKDLKSTEFCLPFPKPPLQKYLDEVFVIEGSFTKEKVRKIRKWIYDNNVSVKNQPALVCGNIKVLISVWEYLLRDIAATVYSEASRDKDERQAIAEVLRNRATLKRAKPYYTAKTFFKKVTTGPKDIVARTGSKYRDTLKLPLGKNDMLDDVAMIGPTIRGLLNNSKIIEKYRVANSISNLKNKYKLDVTDRNEILLCKVRNKSIALSASRFIRSSGTKKDTAYFWEGITYFPPKGKKYLVGEVGKTYQMFPECHSKYPGGKFKKEIYREIVRVGRSSFQSYSPNHARYGMWP